MVNPVPAELLARWTSQSSARNGVRLCVRPLRPDDREREIEFINSLSERTRYYRLMTPLKFLPPHLLDRLMDIDYDRRMAFVATPSRTDGSSSSASRATAKPTVPIRWSSASP